MPNNELLDTATAAKLLGLTAWTLERMRSRGEGPRWIQTKKNARVRYLSSDVSQWLADNRRGDLTAREAETRELSRWLLERNPPRDGEEIPKHHAAPAVTASVLEERQNLSRVVHEVAAARDAAQARLTSGVRTGYGFRGDDWWVTDTAKGTLSRYPMLLDRAALRAAVAAPHRAEVSLQRLNGAWHLLLALDGAVSTFVVLPDSPTLALACLFDTAAFYGFRINERSGEIPYQDGASA